MGGVERVITFILTAKKWSRTCRLTNLVSQICVKDLRQNGKYLTKTTYSSGLMLCSYSTHIVRHSLQSVTHYMLVGSLNA